jgi:hypothetical protein
MDALNAARGAIHPLWGGADYTWNIDGLLAVGDSSYAQVFTTGVIEYGDTVLFKDGFAHGDQLRGAMTDALTRALRWLSAVGSAPPVNVAVTLLRARSRHLPRRRVLQDDLLPAQLHAARPTVGQEGQPHWHLV